MRTFLNRYRAGNWHIGLRSNYRSANEAPRAVVDGGTHQARIEQLVSVSSTRYRASTSDLSRSWSSTALRNLILREASRLDAFSGYPVHA